MGTLALVLDAARFGTELSEAAVWSDHITLCLAAPNSERGSVAAWGQLLDARAKYERVIINGAPTTEGWLLRELQDTGALRLIDSATQRFSSNLLVFRRGAEVRTFVAHVGLTRAAVQVECGAVVAFEGTADSDFALSCQRLVDEWRELSRVSGRPCQSGCMGAPPRGISHAAQRLNPDGVCWANNALVHREACRDGTLEPGR